MKKSQHLKRIIDLFRRPNDQNQETDEIDIEEVRQSGLFDPDWYSTQYPDIKTSGVNPLRHFMVHGWKELRNPNAQFDTKWYLETYPDSRSDGSNPLIHYIRCGAVEGRSCKATNSNCDSIALEFALPPTFLDFLIANSVEDLTNKAQDVSKYPDPFVAYSKIMKE